MSLEERYKKETGFDVGKIHDIGMHYCSNDYVEWLESLVDSDCISHVIGFSATDMKKSFDAGEALKAEEWHREEFHTGEHCRCGNTWLEYDSFDEWMSNYR